MRARRGDGAPTARRLFLAAYPSRHGRTCFSKVCHNPASRHRTVSFEAGGKNCVLQRKAWPSSSSFLECRNSRTQIAQQIKEAFLFMGLCCVVSAPILRIGFFTGGFWGTFGIAESYGGPRQMLHSPNILTLVTVGVVIWAGALIIPRPKPYAVSTIAAPGGD